MSTQPIALVFKDQGPHRTVESGGASATSMAGLVEALPLLQEPANLGRYVEAVNFLARGVQYTPIFDPDEFRAQYEKRFAAEDPTEPYLDGQPRLSRFGHAELEEIQAPRVEGASVIFYAEHTYLGIPYRVTAPAPAGPAEVEVSYLPVPMRPVEE